MIAVVDSGNHGVQLFAKYGPVDVPAVIGKKGDAPGELNNPTGVLVRRRRPGAACRLVEPPAALLPAVGEASVELDRRAPEDGAAASSCSRRGATWHDGATFNDDEAALKETVLSDPTMSKSASDRPQRALVARQ